MKRARGPCSPALMGAVDAHRVPPATRGSAAQSQEREGTDTARRRVATGVLSWPQGTQPRRPAVGESTPTLPLAGRHSGLHVSLLPPPADAGHWPLASTPLRAPLEGQPVPVAVLTPASGGRLRLPRLPGRGSLPAARLRDTPCTSSHAELTPDVHAVCLFTCVCKGVLPVTVVLGSRDSRKIHPGASRPHTARRVARTPHHGRLPGTRQTVPGGMGGSVSWNPLLAQDARRRWGPETSPTVPPGTVPSSSSGKAMGLAPALIPRDLQGIKGLPPRALGCSAWMPAGGR